MRFMIYDLQFTISRLAIGPSSVATVRGVGNRQSAIQR